MDRVKFGFGCVERLRRAAGDAAREASPAAAPVDVSGAELAAISGRPVQCNFPARSRASLPVPDSERCAEPHCQ